MLGAIGIIPGGQPFFDISQHSGIGRQVRLLRQIAHGCARLQKARAGIGFHQTGGDFQQGRFARTVAAHQSHALAKPDSEFRAVKQRSATKGQTGILQMQERRCSHSQGVTERA